MAELEKLGNPKNVVTWDKTKEFYLGKKKPKVEATPPPQDEPKATPVGLKRVEDGEEKALGTGSYAPKRDGEDAGELGKKWDEHFQF